MLLPVGSVSHSVACNSPPLTCARALALLLEFGHLDKPKPRPSFDKNAGRKAARDIAEAGAVLLKNDRFVLPLKVDALKDIAWIGLPFERPVIGGGGSAQVTPTHITSINTCGAK